MERLLVYFVFFEHNHFNSTMFSRYDKIIPRLHATQLSAAIGINRMLVLTHMIDIPLTLKTSDETEDDNININHRQVTTLAWSSNGCHFVYFRNIYSAMLFILAQQFENIFI